MTISQAPMLEASRDHLFGAWSDLQVGDRPEGLVSCYLMEADGLVQIASVWASAEAHERAVAGDERHPGLFVFEACGIDPSHSVLKVVGRIT